VFVFAARLCFLKFLNFFSFKLIFLYILDCFDVLILKIKKNYFDIFLNKKYFKNIFTIMFLDMIFIKIK